MNNIYLIRPPLSATTLCCQNTEAELWREYFVVRQNKCACLFTPNDEYAFFVQAFSFTFVSFNQPFSKKNNAIQQVQMQLQLTSKPKNGLSFKWNIKCLSKRNFSILLCTELFYNAKMKIMRFQCGLFELSLVSFDTAVLPTLRDDIFNAKNMVGSCGEFRWYFDFYHINMNFDTKNWIKQQLLYSLHLNSEIQRTKAISLSIIVWIKHSKYFIRFFNVFTCLKWVNFSCILKILWLMTHV